MFVRTVAALFIAVSQVFPLSSAADDHTAAPATRIVSLAPHLTELVFTAGAGDRLVGTSAYSDYPPQAAAIPVVSDAFTVDQEQLAVLGPDLVLAWKSGTPVRVVDELRRQGYRVAVIETRALDDIPPALERIGRLTGNEREASRAAGHFAAELERLRAAHASAAPVSVFYQVSARPLYTVSDDHYIGEIIALCGGRNVFADLGELAPAVDVEAVVHRNPDVLLAGSADGSQPFDDWLRFPALAANRYGNRFVVDADTIGRPTLRLVNAARAVCNRLETARERIAAARTGDQRT